MAGEEIGEGAPLPAFRFPVFGFQCDGGMHIFTRASGFDGCPASHVKSRCYEQMRLLDDAGRNWRVLRVRELPRARGLWVRLRDRLRGDRYCPVAYDLVEEPGALSLDEAKQLVCAVIDENPFAWTTKAFARGEGPEPDLELLINRLKARIRQARSPAAMLEAMNAAFDEPKFT